MNTEKTIQICGKDVIMRYCAGAETGYEILSGKSSDVFVPTVAERDENGKPTKFDPPKAMTDDYIKLAIATIIAAYDFRSDEHNTVEPPVTTKEIIFSASPAEITSMIQTVVELRTKWYAIPSTVPESEFEEETGKGEQKNAQQPATDFKES